MGCGSAGKAYARFETDINVVGDMMCQAGAQRGLVDGGDAIA